MPVEFPSDEQAIRYGCYHADPSPEQLARFCYLSPQDIRFLANYRRFYTKFGCAVQLCTLRFLGTFLPVPTQVPAVVIQTLAQQRSFNSIISGRAWHCNGNETMQ